MKQNKKCRLIFEIRKTKAKVDQECMEKKGRGKKCIWSVMMMVKEGDQLYKKVRTIGAGIKESQ